MSGVGQLVPTRLLSEHGKRRGIKPTGWDSKGIDVSISGFRDEIKAITDQTRSYIDNHTASNADGANVYFMDNRNVLCFPRETGDSRYVFGDNGFNFWVHASGYMYANEGLFSTFMRRKEGDEPVIGFFTGIPVSGGRMPYRCFSLMPVPVLGESEEFVERRYTVLNPAAAYFFTEFNSLLSVVRVTVNQEKRIAFSVYIENKGDAAADIFNSSFFKPFCRYSIYESDEDRWFIETALTDGVSADGVYDSGKMEVSQDEDRFTSMTYYAVLRGKHSLDDGATFNRRLTNTSRHNLLGESRRNLSAALGLRTGEFAENRHVTTFTDIAVFNDINFFNLAPGAAVRTDYTFQSVSEKEEQESVAATAIIPAEIDKSVATSGSRISDILSSLSIQVSGIDESLEIKENDFNEFFRHLKYQVSVCGLLQGYMQLQLRSLIGIRDVFQALEGLLYYRPDASRAKMLEALGFTITDGRCLRQYSLPPKGAAAGRADCREFIDQGVWVISTIHTYLESTGDQSFLEAEIGYHEITDEATESIIPSAEKGTVLEHLFRIMDYLNRNRDHDTTKLVLALYGDWNDALDGLGITKDPEKEFGTGVSVMATLQFYQNCTEMIRILECFYPDQFNDKLEQYRTIRDEIAENLIEYAVYQDDLGNDRIYHGWGDNREYYVGGPCDPDGVARDGVTSYAFWALSGMLERTPEMEAHICSAFDRLQSKYGLMTFNPHFPKNTPGVGRIPKLPPGTAENGATYIHATLFAIMAYFRMGRAKEGWDEIQKVLPFTSIHDKYSHSPFVMPNSYVFNEEKGMDGESMNDWQTGSSNVLLKILLWHVYGYKPDFNGIRIQIADWTPFQEFKLETTTRKKTVRVSYRKAATASGAREFIINGTSPVQGERDSLLKTDCRFIPYDQLADVNEIEVVDPIDA